MPVDTQLLLICLQIMGVGMLGIFAVILVIWGLVALINRLTFGKAEPKSNADP